MYGGAVGRVEGNDAKPGDLVEVLDEHGTLLGVGTYNPEARIAIRMLGRSLGPGGTIESLVAERVAQARDRRARLGLPSEATTAYRLINGEGDGLPGVMCDVLGDLASIEITTAGAERWLPTLVEAIGCPRVSVRVPPDSARFESIPPGDRLVPGRTALIEEESHVELRENGITWRLLPGKGQKTGFYTDQRENRALVATLAAGGSMLDCFCYTGGFGLNAARAGATEVVGADSSGPAVSVAAGTAKANDLDQTKWFKEDALRFMRGLGERKFDTVVLDPPKLARRRDNLDDAYKKYLAFNAEGIGRVKDGGWLVSCSCSGLVDQPMFLRMLSDAAHRAERQLVVHQIRGAGPDYPIPVAFDEGRYLICVVASVLPR